MEGIKEARGLQSPPGTFRTKVRLDRRPRLRPAQKHQVNRAFGRTVNCLILVQIAHGDAYLDSFPWLKAEAGISCLDKPGPSHFKTSLEAVPEFPT